MREIVKSKYDIAKGTPPAKGGDFIRLTGRNLTVSASLRNKIIDWERVDYSFNREKQIIFILKNNKNGLYKTWTNGQVFQINGIAVFHKLGVHTTKVRIPAELSGEEIKVKYSKFKDQQNL